MSFYLQNNKSQQREKSTTQDEEESSSDDGGDDETNSESEFQQYGQKGPPIAKLREFSRASSELDSDSESLSGYVQNKSISQSFHSSNRRSINISPHRSSVEISEDSESDDNSSYSQSQTPGGETSPSNSDNEDTDCDSSHKYSRGPSLSRRYPNSSSSNSDSEHSGFDSQSSESEQEDFDQSFNGSSSPQTSTMDITLGGNNTQQSFFFPSHSILQSTNEISSHFPYNQSILNSNNHHRASHQIRPPQQNYSFVQKTSNSDAPILILDSSDEDEDEQTITNTQTMSIPTPEQKQIPKHSSNSHLPQISTKTIEDSKPAYSNTALQIALPQNYGSQTHSVFNDITPPYNHNPGDKSTNIDPINNPTFFPSSKLQSESKSDILTHYHTLEIEFNTLKAKYFHQSNSFDTFKEKAYLLQKQNFDKMTNLAKQRDFILESESKLRNEIKDVKNQLSDQKEITETLHRRNQDLLSKLSEYSAQSIPLTQHKHDISLIKSQNSTTLKQYNKLNEMFQKQTKIINHLSSKLSEKVNQESDMKQRISSLENDKMKYKTLLAHLKVQFKSKALKYKKMIADLELAVKTSESLRSKRPRTQENVDVDGVDMELEISNGHNPPVLKEEEEESFEPATDHDREQYQDQDIFHLKKVKPNSFQDNLTEKTVESSTTSVNNINNATADTVTISDASVQGVDESSSKSTVLTKILHLKLNPLSIAIDNNKDILIDTLQQELVFLKNSVEDSESISKQAQELVSLRTKVGSLTEKLSEYKKRYLRIQTISSKQIEAFRTAVYYLLGYTVEMDPLSGTFVLQSKYVEDSEAESEKIHFNSTDNCNFNLLESAGGSKMMKVFYSITGRDSRMLKHGIEPPLLLSYYSLSKLVPMKILTRTN